MNEETKQTLEEEIRELEEDKETDILVDQEKKKDYKKVKKQKRKRALFIIWNLLSILYYAISSFISINKDFKNDVFTYIILGSVAIYTIIFIVILIKTSTNKKIASTNMATFKTQLKIWKTILALFNIALTINILINALMNAKHWSVIVLIVYGFIFVYIRILISLINIFIQIMKQSRINKKRRKLQQKYLEKK